MNENLTPKIIGQMDNTIDHTLESANRVYDLEGISPAINVVKEEVINQKL